MSDMLRPLLERCVPLSREQRELSRLDIRMAQLEAVSRALRNDNHLIMETSTTSYRALPWLIPILADALESDGKVLIVTATGQRQSQLLEQEIPLLRRCWPTSFSVARWRPWEEFLCLERLAHAKGQLQRQRSSATQEETQNRPLKPLNNRCHGKRPTRYSASSALGRLPRMVGFSAGECVQLEALIAWSQTTKSGHRLERPKQVTDRIWQPCTVSPANCLAEACPLVEACFAKKDRKQAADATLWLWDYSELYARLARSHGSATACGTDSLSNATFGSAANTSSDATLCWGLPSHQVLVLDEAHMAAELARQAFGFELSPASVKALLPPLIEIGAYEQAAFLWAKAEGFFKRLTDYRHSPSYQVRLEESQPVNGTKLLEALEDAAEFMGRAADPALSVDRLLHHRAQALTLASRLEASLSLSDPHSVLWLESDGLGQTVVKGKPVEVAKLLSPLFQRSRVVLATSDTIAVQGRAEAMRLELGIPETATWQPASEACAATKRLLLVVPEILPDPSERSWPRVVTCRFMDIQRVTEGRAIGWFTSDEVLDHVQLHARFLGVRIERDSLDGVASVDLVLPQSIRPIESARERTQKTDKGKGKDKDKDTPADTGLVLDRLPFPHPDDPLLDIMKEHDPRWFVRFALPRAVLSFRQALIRLLESKAKRVVVVVLDRRLMTRSYGRVFCSCLPGVTISRSLDDIAPFLAGKRVWGRLET